ncbi:MAG: SAV_915 family protein [Nocardioidaceae bacterium]
MTQGQRRPTILDPDDFEFLPEEVHVPVEGVTVDGEVLVGLQESTYGGRVLPVYSSEELLTEACGSAQQSVVVPVGELADLQERLDFDTLMIDVRQPDDLRVEASTDEEVPDPPVATDPATGDVLVYIPCRSWWADGAEVEMRELEDGSLAVLIYSSLDTLCEGCGPQQTYVQVRTRELEEILRQCGTEQVLIDVSLPADKRHR